MFLLEVMVSRAPGEPEYRSLVSVPAGKAPPSLAAETKLAGLLRVLGKPLEVLQAESKWLDQRLPREEADFLRKARVDLLVPIATMPGQREGLLALGIKRSEERVFLVMELLEGSRSATSSTGTVLLPRLESSRFCATCAQPSQRRIGVN